jgi:two-component system OmpR family response regulator
VANPPTAASRSILVVDDNHDAAESLAILLELRGHRVRVARDGPAAIAAASSTEFDFILLDLGLPGMDGFAVARELRQRIGAAGPRVVALTGHGRAEDRERTRAAGFHQHLTKPVTREQLDTLLAVP